MPNASQIHQSVLEHTRDLFVAEIPESERLKIIFRNYRTRGSHSQGLRLSNVGHKILSRVFDSWAYNHKTAITNKVILSLDSTMTWPYYIDKTTVVFYSTTDAAMFKLNGEELGGITEII